MFIDKAHAAKQGQHAHLTLRAAGMFNVTSQERRPRLGRVRLGKTRRDHDSGSWKQRLDNRTARNG